MDIGKRIRLRREELGYTQEELAFKLGYKSRSSVNKVENTRELSLKKVGAFARVLECSPSYLLGWEDQNLKSQAETRFFEEKVKVYDLFGYESYFLIEVLSHIDSNKKKELVNFAKYLVSDSETKDEILSEEEIRKVFEKSFIGDSDFENVLLEYEERYLGQNCLLNASHPRDDIEATEEMKKHDDDLFDED